MFVSITSDLVFNLLANCSPPKLVAIRFASSGSCYLGDKRDACTCEVGDVKHAHRILRVLYVCMGTTCNFHNQQNKRHGASLEQLKQLQKDGLKKICSGLLKKDCYLVLWLLLEGMWQYGELLFHYKILSLCHEHQSKSNRTATITK